MRTCTIDGCDSRHYALGLCVKHRARLIKHGDPSVAKPRGNRKTRGPAHARWAEDKSYGAVHQRLIYDFGKASAHGCDFCFSMAKDWAYTHDCPEELTELKQGKVLPYSRDLTRYIPLCRPCHRRFDR